MRFEFRQGGVLLVGDAPGGHYRDKVLAQEPKSAGLYHVDVFHDDWCAIWQGRKCNCDPHLVTQKHVADA